MSTKRAITALIAIALVSGCGRNDIFEKPPVGSPELPPKPLETSYITLATSIPFRTIQKVADANVPPEQSFSGSGDEPCTNVPKIEKGSGILEVPYIGSQRACAGHSWSAVARKSGPVTVTKYGDAMRVSVPIQIGGKAGLRGDIASVLSLSGKNFDASVKPIVDITVSTGSDWCPQINATPTQQWVSNATVEIIGKNCAKINLGVLGSPGFCAGPVKLDLTNQANSVVNGQQDAIKKAAASAINCDKLRQSIQSQWKPIVVPVDSSGENPLFLNITPESFAISSIQVVDSALQFAVKAGVKAQLDGQAASTKPIPLPPLEAVTADSSDLRVVVRANVDYSMIADTLKKSVLGKTFIGTTPAGDVTVTAVDVEVFPSNGKIAVGVKIAADLPSHYLDVNGWVYMTAVPTVTQFGATIELGELSYSTVLNNKLWDALVAVFDKQVLQELQKNSKIDLGPTISKSSEDLASKINSTSVPGLSIKAEKPVAKLLDVAIDSKALIASASAEMKFSITLTDEIVQTASK
ncbi:DUF4403 family protein [Pseudomonas otitidis]|uniref:DUF4403 family protein n=1 Tax=Metapseudomonas otitidis TaxID=319939 RepID=UPI0024AD1D14|nr:DUF4403 family protein [Pseudomonas otitidis]MDI6528376.1 DUF4403 family protein [Pseudomonas otitidis]